MMTINLDNRYVEDDQPWMRKIATKSDGGEWICACGQNFGDATGWSDQQVNMHVKSSKRHL